MLYSHVDNKITSLFLSKHLPTPQTVYTACMYLILHAAITCETLPAPENGMVSYSTNNNATGTFSFGTEAYFSCDVGFFLIGDETIRTCVGGNITVGKFNGTTPACEGSIIMFHNT